MNWLCTFLLIWFAFSLILGGSLVVLWAFVKPAPLYLIKGYKRTN